MERYLQKPQMKNEEEFMKQEYPEKTQKIYKAAYLDGFKDAVYFNDI